MDEGVEISAAASADDALPAQIRDLRLSQAHRHEDLLAVLSQGRRRIGQLGGRPAEADGGAAFAPRLALVAGAAGVALFLGLSSLVLGLAPDRARHLAGLVAVGLFSIGSALAIGLGRAQLGVGQATSARYVTWASLLWVANAGLVGLAFALGGAAGGSRLRSLATRVMLGAVGLALVVGVVMGFPVGVRDGAILSARVRETRDAVLAAYPDVSRATLRPVSPRPGRALALLPRVHERRLSLFRER